MNEGGQSSTGQVGLYLYLRFLGRSCGSMQLIEFMLVNHPAYHEAVKEASQKKTNVYGGARAIHSQAIQRFSFHLFSAI